MDSSARANPSNPPQPGRIGQAALERSWITRAQLDECVKAQKAALRRGEEMRLAVLLVERGFLTHAQVHELLRDQGKVLLQCTGCLRKVNAPRGTEGQIPCAHCGCKLAPVGADGSLEACGSWIEEDRPRARSVADSSSPPRLPVSPAVDPPPAASVEGAARPTEGTPARSLRFRSHRERLAEARRKRNLAVAATAGAALVCLGLGWLATRPARSADSQTAAGGAVDAGGTSGVEKAAERDPRAEAYDRLQVFVTAHRADEVACWREVRRVSEGFAGSEWQDRVVALREHWEERVVSRGSARFEECETLAREWERSLQFGAALRELSAWSDDEDPTGRWNRRLEREREVVRARAAQEWKFLEEKARSLARDGRHDEARRTAEKGLDFGLEEIAGAARRVAEELARTARQGPTSVAEAGSGEAPAHGVSETPGEAPFGESGPRPGGDAAPVPTRTDVVWTIVSRRSPSSVSPADSVAERKRRHTQRLRAAKQAREEAERAKQQADLARLQRLERELGVYEVATLTDKGDSARRIDVVIVTAGFPKSDAAKLRRMADRLRDSILGIEPFRNYPEYINFHRVLVDDPDLARARIPITVHTANNMVTAEWSKSLAYGAIAPDCDLVAVLTNVTGVRATGAAPVITIDASGDMSDTFRHEMGHAFGRLADEYVSQVDEREFFPDEEDEHVGNVTREPDARKAKWHYWLPATWQTPHFDHARPGKHTVGCFEGGYYREKGVWRPEVKCLMNQCEGEFCLVCFEQVERQVYRLVNPIQQATPGRLDLAVWRNDSVEFSAEVLQTSGKGEAIGRFAAFWTVDGRGVPAGKSKGLVTSMRLDAATLDPGAHEVGLRFDFWNRRIRRDEGWLSDTRAWRIDVGPHPRPPLEAPGSAKGTPDSPVEFGIRCVNPDPRRYRLEIHDMPDGASTSGDRFVWTPTSADRGAWRPRFVVTDGSRSVEAAVTISVVDGAANLAPTFSVLPAHTGAEGEPIEIDGSASDEDGDHLLYTAANLPDGASLDAHEGVFRWTPGPSQSGRYNIGVEAYDGRTTAKSVLEIVVLDVAADPAVAGLKAASRAHLAGIQTGAGSKGEGRGILYQGFDMAFFLRSSSPEMRIHGLRNLEEHTRTYRLLEAARLLRDRFQRVRAAALEVLRGLVEDPSPGERNLLVCDLAPHVWHFADDGAVLAWLGQLAERSGEADPQRLKVLRSSLRAVEKYNQDRGVAR